MHTMGSIGDDTAHYPSNGNPIIQYTWTGDWDLWALLPEFYYGLRFRPKVNHFVDGVDLTYCMDLDNRQNVNGSKVQIWDCLNGSNQAWRFRKLSP